MSITYDSTHSADTYTQKGMNIHTQKHRPWLSHCNAAARIGENTGVMMMLCSGGGSGNIVRTERAIIWKNEKSGVFHAPARLEQRIGTQPIGKKRQLSDIECSKHRHGARLVSGHGS